MRTTLAVLACVVSVSVSAPVVAEPEIATTLQFRIRWEAFDTPSGVVARDSSYDFTNFRVRAGLSSRWDHVTLLAELQGAAVAELPSNGAFAIGPVYASANPGESRPSQIGFSQLTAAVHSDSAKLIGGRQKWADSGETTTGVGYLDGIKRRRLAERLVGNWDWVNVGRRFDGVSGGAELGSSHLAGFAFRPLAGGVNYLDGFNQLDGLEIYGATWTGKYDEVLPASELRLFTIRYDDDRPGAVAAASGKIAVNTFGASLLAGSDAHDLVLWGVFQNGDWGASPHEAWAFLVEAGRRFEGVERSVVLRAGIAAASGDDRSSESHRSFFNLLPTNHKWYGSMDYNAFSNLRNVFAELLYQSNPQARWQFRGAYHLFHLIDARDAWYGGSGAFDLGRLGYAGRRPAAGDFVSKHIGHEVDLTVGFKFHARASLQFGYSYFFGGDAAAQVLSVDKNGSWGFAQLVLQK